MQLIFDDRQKRTIKDKEEINFSSFSSYHLIIVTARAKSEKQLGGNATDDEDLMVKIDNKDFPKLNTKKAFFNSPAALSGGRLHNLAKTVYFLAFLKGRDHSVTLETDEEPNTATFENLQVYAFDFLEQNLSLDINNQAEDGDRRPWITFVLDNLPLNFFTPTLTYSRRRRDSDDIKIIIDGNTKRNILRNIKHFLWRFVGLLLPKFSPTKTETQTFTANLSQGLHYIEFYADRMPTLKKISFDFELQPPIPEEVPTLDNPKWAGSFYDDPTVVLFARVIFGEAENQPKEAKIGVGFTVVNRVKKQRNNWGLTVREVILKENQYDAMWNPDRKDVVKDPLTEASEARQIAWQESYEVAVGILNNSLKDPTNGATHFHSFKRKEDFPSWATDKRYRTTLGQIHFYELEA